MPQLTKVDFYKAKIKLAKNFSELENIVKDVQNDNGLIKWQKTSLMNEAEFVRQDKGFYND